VKYCEFDTKLSPYHCTILLECYNVENLMLVKPYTKIRLMDLMNLPTCNTVSHQGLSLNTSTDHNTNLISTKLASS